MQRLTKYCGCTARARDFVAVQAGHSRRTKQFPCSRNAGQRINALRARAGAGLHALFPAAAQCFPTPVGASCSGLVRFNDVDERATVGALAKLRLGASRSRAALRLITMPGRAVRTSRGTAHSAGMAGLRKLRRGLQLVAQTPPSAWLSTRPGAWSKLALCGNKHERHGLFTPQPESVRMDFHRACAYQASFGLLRGLFLGCRLRQLSRKPPALLCLCAYGATGLLRRRRLLLAASVAQNVHKITPTLVTRLADPGRSATDTMMCVSLR